MRITMPGTPKTLSIEGVHIRPDEHGAYDVPEYHAHEMVKVHGGAYAPAAPAAPVAAPATDASGEASAVVEETKLRLSTKTESRKK